MGFIFVPSLCEPSQKGLFLVLPQAQYTYLPGSIKRRKDFSPRILGSEELSIVNGI